MDEGDEAALGTQPRLFVDQTGPLRTHLLERGVYVLDLDGDMMYTAAAFFQEFADRGIFGRRFEQFYAALAQRQHRDSDLLVLDYLRVYVLEAHRADPELQGLIDTFRSYTQMAYLHFCNSCSTAEYGSVRLSPTSRASSSSISL